MRELHVYIGEYVLIGRIKETTKGYRVYLITPVVPRLSLKKLVFETLPQAACAVTTLFPKDMWHNIKYYEFDGIHVQEVVI